MASETNNQVTRVLGAADAFALLAEAFKFPYPDLAAALSDGRFADDAEGALRDMGVDEADARAAADAVRSAAAQVEPEALLEAMRVDYSALFYGLGRFRVMSPYESVFRKLAANPNARATAFLTRSTHEVEDAMRGRGVLPGDYRREPADHFATELDFVRHLLTGYAGALQDPSYGDVGEWCADAGRFLSSHVQPWVPDLFRCTKDECGLPLYAALADMGLLVLAHVESVFE